MTWNRQEPVTLSCGCRAEREPPRPADDRPGRRRPGGREAASVPVFHDEGPKGKTKQIVLSVKAGHVKPEFVRELRGVVEREEAAIGVLLTLHPPTLAMRKEQTNRTSGGGAKSWPIPFGRPSDSGD